MTPEQIKECAEKIRNIEKKLSILVKDNTYLIIKDSKVFFKTDTSDAVYLCDNLTNVWILLAKTCKAALVNQLQEQIQELCKEPS